MSKGWTAIDVHKSPNNVNNSGDVVSLLLLYTGLNIYLLFVPQQRHLSRTMPIDNVDGIWNEVHLDSNFVRVGAKPKPTAPLYFTINTFVSSS